MTITTTYIPISYQADGVATNFPITWQYAQREQIIVRSQVVATGVITLLVYGTDYTITPQTNSPAGIGTVSTLGTPLASGIDILITRSTEETQETHWTPNDPFPAQSIEDAVDKLTMIDQEVAAGQAITDAALGDGDATYSTFLRGLGPTPNDERIWTNTLIGPDGPPAVQDDVQSIATFENNGASAIRVLGGLTDKVSYRFGNHGSAYAWDMELVYDPATTSWGWRDGTGGSIRGAFGADGNVNFTQDLIVAGDLSFGGTITGGSADGSLITTGLIPTARLGSGAASSSTVLYGDQVWRVVSGGGGGINTTTTGTFVIAAVNSTQTVPVTSATGIVAGTELIIGDGTHQITGLVTVVASLNLTVKTQQISLGSAGNTMASGAAVQSGTLPGNNTIQVSDSATSPTSASVLTFTGDLAGSGSLRNFDLYVNSVIGGTAQIKGYLTAGSITSAIFQTAENDEAGVVGFANHAVSHSSTIIPTAFAQVLQCTGYSGITGATTVGFSLIGASNVTPGSLTPPLLNATNSPSVGQVPAYASATQVTWTTPVIGSGTTAQFLNGAGTSTNVLGSNGSLVMAKTVPVSNGVRGLQLSYPVNSNSSGSLNIVEWSVSDWIDSATRPWMTFTAPFVVANGSYAVSAIDGVHGATEAAIGMNSRTVRSARSDMGFWGKMRAVSNPTGTQTINPATCPYVRFESILSDFTIAIADTSDAPTVSGIAYATEITIEIDLCTKTITWPGAINWVDGGSAPTPDATGYTIIKLIRAQDVVDGHGAVWFGYRLASSSAAAYTDAQARSAVIDSTYLINSSTIDMAVVAGASTTPFVKTGSIGNTQLASGIFPSKLLGAGSSTTTFLRNDGTWATPAGGGGGGTWPTSNPTQSYTWLYKQNFSGPQTFNSNGFGSPVGSSATGTVSFNNYYPNDNLSPETACAARISLVNSYLPGVSEELTALCVDQVNQSAAGGGQGCVKFGLSNLQNITSGFSIALQQTAQQRRINGASGDGVWLNSWSPCQVFSGTPDAQGITHSWGSGFVRIGECNYGNAWADFGRMEDRLGSHYCAGLEFFPDWLPGDTGATGYTKYPASWAIAIGAAAAGPVGAAPKNWTGILMTQDGLVGGANVYGAGGFGINIRGGSTAALAPAIGVKIQDHIDVALDTSSATITAEATSGHSNQAAILLAQGQAICFKAPTGANTGVFMQYNGTNLRVTKDGGNTWTNLV